LYYYYLANNLIAAQAPGIQWSEEVKKKRDCIEKVVGRGAIELERVVLMLCDSKTLRGCPQVGKDENLLFHRCIRHVYSLGVGTLTLGTLNWQSGSRYSKNSALTIAFATLPAI
jgi:hypothetical protein